VLAGAVIWKVVAESQGHGLMAAIPNQLAVEFLVVQPALNLNRIEFKFL
jgi:hypothetical protein